MAAGAFGAHGLSGKLKDDSSLSAEDRSRRLDWFETGARYHMYHALAVVLVGLVATRHPSIWLTVAGNCFVLGILIFSGCLYAMALGAPKFLGAIVPIGGTSFIAGWVGLAIAAFRAD
ncbi:MAG TPA: DUF423 domain-containing protein [Pirellulales bacterium]|nr:DUF423 domain-containing protein [Pirellulales bacterium]